MAALALRGLARLLVVLLALTKAPLVVRGLEARWTGNEDNAPLPQSAKYRANLRKLCSSLHSGGRLPKSYDEKKEDLQKMCAKLQRDDDNVSTAMTVSTLKRAVLVLGGIAGLAYALNTHGATIVSAVKRFLSSRFGRKSSIQVAKKTRGGATDLSQPDYSSPLALEMSGENIELMRLARLQRFAAVGSNVVDDGKKDM